MQAQLQQLQQGKEATLTQVQKLQNQQGVNIGLFQRTATNVQNTANTSAAHQVQLSSSIRSQLDNITKILNSNFGRINENLKKYFYNENLIYNTIEIHHQHSKQQFASIEAQLTRLGMQPQAPIVQSLQPYCIQHYAVPLLE